MGKELEMQIPKDQSKVNTNNLGEFIWWSAHLGTGYERLLSIIEKVGNKPADIRKYIDDYKSNTNVNIH